MEGTLYSFEFASKLSQFKTGLRDTYGESNTSQRLSMYEKRLG